MERTTRVVQNFLRLTQDLRKSSPLFLLLLCLAPLCIVVWVLQSKNDNLEMAAGRIEILEQKALSAQHIKIKQQSAWELAQKSNPLYLSQTVEALPLLTPELHRVQALARQYPKNRSLHERLFFLQSDKNKIRFVQTAERSDSFFQESELKMEHSVQMNEDDLKTFLAAIEEPAKDRPLLVIKSFELKKLKEKADETVYDVQIEVIKRSL
jgi:hypothetical protein